MKFRVVLIVMFVLPALCTAQSSSVNRQPVPAHSKNPDWNWADEDVGWSQTPQYAGSKAICDGLRGLEPPEADWPDEATADTLTDCNFEALYYGVGMTAAPVRARQCALLEPHDYANEAWNLSSTAMLMIIYANGVGAERNLDLATSLACRIEGASFQNDGAVKRLRELVAEGWSGHDFSYCQYVSDLELDIVCGSRDREIADANRSDRFDKLSRSWTELEHVQFSRLLAAMEDYAGNSSEYEVDSGGTAYNSFMWGWDQQVRDEFLEMLEELQSDRFPAISAAHYRTANAQLRLVYRQILAINRDEYGRIGFGTVRQSDILATQRVWLSYRDAWSVFVAVKYPKVRARSVKTELTRKRVGFLEELVPSW